MAPQRALLDPRISAAHGFVNPAGKTAPRESLPWLYELSAAYRSSEIHLSHHPHCCPSLPTLKLVYLQELMVPCAVERHSISNRLLSCLTIHAKLHLGDCWCLLSSVLQQITLGVKEGESCLPPRLTIPCKLSLGMKTLNVSTIWIPLHGIGYASLNFGICSKWLTKSHFIGPLMTQGGWANVI